MPTQAELASLGVKELREWAPKEGCSAAEIEAAWNTEAPKESLAQLILSNRLRQRALQQGCTKTEVAGAFGAFGSEAALDDLLERDTWELAKNYARGHPKSPCAVCMGK